MLLWPLVTLVGLVGLWQLAMVVWEPPAYLVPTPHAVWQVFRENGRTMVRATWITARAAVLALVVAVAVGTVVSAVLASSEVLYRSLFPLTVFFQTTPTIAIAPLVLLWFDVGTASIVAVSVIVSIFPIIANLTTGLRATPPELLQLFALYRAPRWATLLKLRLPYALPYFFVGLRIAAGLSVIGAIVGEYVAGMAGTQAGLGFVLVEASARLLTDKVIAATLACALLGSAMLKSIDLLSMVTLRHWHTPESA